MPNLLGSLAVYRCTQLMMKVRSARSDSRLAVPRASGRQLLHAPDHAARERRASRPAAAARRRSCTSSRAGERRACCCISPRRSTRRCSSCRSHAAGLRARLPISRSPATPLEGERPSRWRLCPLEATVRVPTIDAAEVRLAAAGRLAAGRHKLTVRTLAAALRTCDVHARAAAAAGAGLDHLRARSGYRLHRKHRHLPCGARRTADRRGRKRVEGLTMLDHVATLASSVVMSVALVDLFRLKRRAFPLFATSLAISIASLLASLALNPAFRAMFLHIAAVVHRSRPGSSISRSWRYIWRLRRKGVLR